MTNFDIVSFRNGDERELKNLFEEFYPMLQRRVYNLIGDRETAKDISLTVFANLWKVHDKLESLDAIRAYLLGAGQKASYYHIRKKMRRETNETAFSRSFEQLVIEADELEEEHELITRIRREIEKLPGRCKEIFKMLIYEELSPVEVAEKLNITVNNVHQQKFTAIERLKDHFRTNKGLPLLLAIFIYLYYFVQHAGIGNW